SPLPSTTVRYLLIGRSVKWSTRVLGLGQRISTQSTLSAFPRPRISRGSWLERKLPPAVFNRERTTPPALQRSMAPVAVGFDSVPTSLSPIQWFLDSPLLYSTSGGPPLMPTTTSG